jgi:uncharacterized OsmC-like protein
MPQYEVVVASGTLRADLGESTPFKHRWTDEGVTVQTVFTGAHLLHLAVAGCVLNDVHREAKALGIPVDGVRVTADGGFDPDWSSTGIAYTVDIATDASVEDIDRLLAVVDEVAEIPRTVRRGTTVRRVEEGPDTPTA